MTHKETRGELDQEIVTGWEDKIENEDILKEKNITPWQQEQNRRNAGELLSDILEELPREEKYLPLINYLTIYQKLKSVGS